MQVQRALIRRVPSLSADWVLFANMVAPQFQSDVDSPPRRCPTARRRRLSDEARPYCQRNLLQCGDSGLFSMRRNGDGRSASPFSGSACFRSSMRLRVKSEAVRSPTRGRTECVNHAATISRLVIVAAAEAANQVSYAEGNGGGRVWALLNGGAKEVLSPGGAFENSFHGIRRRLLHLSVDILRGPFNLFCLALKLTF